MAKNISPKSTWNDQVNTGLLKKFGAQKGKSLCKKYDEVFPLNYRDMYKPTVALSDIEYIEKLSAENPLTIRFYKAAEEGNSKLHLRLFKWQKPIPLSDILPMLENLNLRTDHEHPYQILLKNQQCVWISDFGVIYTDAAFDIESIKDLFQEAFSKIYLGSVENDGFNKLIISALLSWREIVILRTYAKYLRQVGFRFSFDYIEKALVNNPQITRDLVALFISLHQPKKGSNKPAASSKASEKITDRIIKALSNVSSLDEDFIIRRYLQLIKATLRTNYFQTDDNGQLKPYLSIKLKSDEIPDLPQPLPLYEIFVYAARFEGIHLRKTKVARGGIRWSDRLEDFRTEILGLMKAQTVKNSIIVPSGAKGGFVLKAALPDSTRETLQTEVVACYSAFISGLLDLTDNIVHKKHIRPKNVVCYDDIDPYLVVAADKGTATFSDIANSLANQYHYWLGDAFASGGSTGYDHKEIGITARGAWESIKRHFREMNIDAVNTLITVIGIGDMSGDVFGNSALYSKHIKLIAAFDHRDIFIDPTPDAKISYQERERLFNLPTSSWQNYNRKLISKGGGVFTRSLKSIKLTPQIKKALNINADVLEPNELIQAILKAPVDLLFNGGIGTYVKATAETNADVGDRTNDYCRINGNELRCKVVGEGGNLGFTQLGRVEYALTGGLINTDFIDNSAGVDCSDHEVNLKILLDAVVKQGKLTEKKRNQLLTSVTNEVATLVLHDNFRQALVMSITSFHANDTISLDSDYINDLESADLIDRVVEFLPDNKALLERKAQGLGLTRPERAVLLAYTKIILKHDILKTALPEDNYLKEIIATAFPESIRKKYYKYMQTHLLRRDIIATQLSNYLVNEMGITFVYRLQMETGATVEEIVRAHAVASSIFGTREIEEMINALDFKITTKEQHEMIHSIHQLINLTTRWFLHGNHLRNELEPIIAHYHSRIRALESLLPELMSGATKDYLKNLANRFEQAGLSREMAARIASFKAIYTILNVIQVSSENKFDLMLTAKVYFKAGERLNLVWFRDQIALDTREGHWNILARLTLRDELDISQREVTRCIMQNNKKEKNPEKLITQWMHSNKRAIARWERILTMLHGSKEVEYTMFFIAIRELISLILSSQ